MNVREASEGPEPTPRNFTPQARADTLARREAAKEGQEGMLRNFTPQGR